MLKVVFFSYFGLIFLMVLNIFNYKKNISKLLFVNNITSHVVVLLVLTSLITKEYSMIDMSMIYVLLGPLVAICLLFFYKYFIPKKPQSLLDIKSINLLSTNEKSITKRPVKRKTLKSSRKKKSAK